jgi:hypothetical protein
MVVARNIHEVSEFKLDETTFLLRVLPHRIILRLDAMGQEDQLELLCRAGCAGWRDFADGEGNVIESTCDGLTSGKLIGGVSVKSPLTEESYNAMPLSVLNLLGVEVLRFNRLSAADTGN